MPLHPTQEWAADWPVPVVAMALLAVLFGLGFVVPASERGRLRAGIFFAGAYLASLFLVSVLAPQQPTLRLLYHLLFCFAAVIVGGFVVFDVLLGRRQIPRILRDLCQGIAYLIA